MKITKAQLKRLIKEELETTMNEVGYGEQGLGRMGSEQHLIQAIYKRLRDGQHTSEKNPLSLEGLLAGVDQYLQELDLDARGIKQAKTYFRKFTRGGEFALADGESVKFVPAKVQVGKSKGEQGLYIV